jgi:hypothetical protein
MNKLAIIGIPIYKKQLNELEKISLQQVCKILYKYPIVFIAADSLDFDYGIEYHRFRVERFPEKYFQNTSSYSQLLLSEMFYQRFLKYKFLLIYQLDAFVFSDQLEKFCLMNYDYIGAPMGYVSHMKKWEGWIGNGGFSLRKINTIIRLLKDTKDMLNKYEEKNLWKRLEDQFFSFCGRNRICNFKSAPVKDALRFSFDSDAKRCYYRNHKELPFGCHAWYKNDYEFYLQFIKNYGYRLDEYIFTGTADKKERKYWAREYLFQRYIKRHEKRLYVRQELEETFGINSKYLIFGSGKIGKECLAVLSKEEIEIIGFWDNDKNKWSTEASKIKIKKPMAKKLLENSIKILIAVSPFNNDIAGNEIVNQLIGLGYVEEYDFIKFTDIKKNVLSRYYNNVCSVN